MLASLTLWFTWLFSGVEESARREVGGPRAKGATTGKASVSWLSDELENGREQATQAQILEPGQGVMTDAGVHALIEMPGVAQIELDGASEVKKISPTEADSAQPKS